MTRPLKESLGTGRAYRADRPAFPRRLHSRSPAEEGRYLRERVVLSNPQSYLAHVLQTGRAEESMTPELPWDHPATETAPESVRAWLNDAQLFSLVHQGEVLLYDLMLAELQDDEPNTKAFSNQLAGWSDAMAAIDIDLHRWDRASMWRRLLRANPRLRPKTREFADHWYELVSTMGSGPIQGPAGGPTADP